MNTICISKKKVRIFRYSTSTLTDRVHKYRVTITQRTWWHAASPRFKGEAPDILPCIFKFSPKHSAKLLAQTVLQTARLKHSVNIRLRFVFECTKRCLHTINERFRVGLKADSLCRDQQIAGEVFYLGTENNALCTTSLVPRTQNKCHSNVVDSWANSGLAGIGDKQSLDMHLL